MNCGVRIILQRNYPKCLSQWHVRGMRDGNTEDFNKPDREEIRDNYSEAANKSMDMAKTVKEKMNDGGKAVREVTERVIDQAEEQRHRDEQNHGEADALKEKLERNQ